MPIDYEKLLALDIPPVEHSYGPKDVMLYALIPDADERRYFLTHGVPRRLH